MEEQLIPAWWTEEIGKIRVVIPEDEKKHFDALCLSYQGRKEIFAAEGASFGQYLICFRDYPSLQSESRQGNIGISGSRYLSENT